jgi:hypothetical protein
MRSLYPWPLFPTDVDSRATRSLSLQLSIQEWIFAFDGIAALEKNPADPHSLSQDVQKLLLFSLSSPFSAMPGTLDKLCFYLHKLLGSSTLTCKSPKENSIEALLDRMHDDLLSFWSKINAWKRSSSSVALISDTIQELCLGLRSTLMEFFDALFPFFEEAKSDENVIFYLIERKAPIDQILQQAHRLGISEKTISRPTMIEDLFCRLYPEGPQHLRTILSEGYTRRGFSEFYAQHKALIESIEWLTDGCSTLTTTSN